MILNALEHPLQSGRSSPGSYADGQTVRTDEILSLLHDREAVSLHELAHQLKRRASDVHRALLEALQDGRVTCLRPVSYRDAPEIFDTPKLSRQIYYRARKNRYFAMAMKQRRLSWTHLSKRPHLAAD